MTRPFTEVDEDGRPYARVQLHARVRGRDCSLAFTPSDSMRIVKEEGNDLYFEAIVYPPRTVIDFTGAYNGPEFHDRLIFESDANILDDYDFFSFFRRSDVTFETRYTQATTNGYGGVAVALIPVFGGKIDIPFPGLKHFVTNFSMYQNLGNLRPNPNISLQYSEYALGISYVWSGKELWGRPQIAPTLDYRGRNIYQTYYTQNAPFYGEKPFLIGATTLPGLGLDASWFPGEIKYPWESKLSHVGFDFSYRYYFGGQLVAEGQPTTFSSYILSLGLQYRLSRKWSIGAGYSRFAQAFVFPSSGNLEQENLTNYYFRLSLVPYIVEGADK